MTYLEKYKQHYGELAMEDYDLYGGQCPRQFAAIRNADANAPFLHDDSTCKMPRCIECWNKEMEAGHEEAN